MDPYKILGVEPHTTSEEIKEAYEQIVKTYNIDEIQEESMKQIYLDKLNEANEAYRLINLNLTCREVRDLIDNNNFIAAESKLNLITDMSSAEWNYLKGIILLKKGWIDSGLNHVKKAVNISPYNSEYIDTLKQLNSKVNNQKSHCSNQQNNPLGLCNNQNSNKKNGLC